MSLLESIAEKAESRVADTEWVARHVRAVREQLAEQEIPEESRAPADAGLEVLERRAGELAETGRYALAVVVGRIALGQDDQAERWWRELRDASFDRRGEMLDEAGRASVAGKRRRERESAEAWVRVRSVALELLKAAGQAALPLLLAAL